MMAFSEKHRFSVMLGTTQRACMSDYSGASTGSHLSPISVTSAHCLEVESSIEATSQGISSGGFDCKTVDGPSSCLDPTFRCALVNWMSAAAGAVGCSCEALFVGVAVLDRLLAAVHRSSCCLGQEQLPLLACACLALGAKIEEADAPPLAAYLPLLSGPCQLSELCAAEVAVLQALDYRLAHIPTTQACLEALLQQLEQLPQQLAQLACYLAEVTLLEASLAVWSPQQLAAACLTYALVMLPQPDALHKQVCQAQQQHLGVCATRRELAPVVAALSAVHYTVTAAAINGRPYAATRKYLDGTHGGVAVLSPVLLTTYSS